MGTPAKKNKNNKRGRPKGPPKPKKLPFSFAPEKFLAINSVKLLTKREKVSLYAYFNDHQVYYSAERAAALAGLHGPLRHMDLFGRNKLSAMGRARLDVAKEFGVKSRDYGIGRRTNESTWSYETWLNFLPANIRELWDDSWVPDIAQTLHPLPPENPQKEPVKTPKGKDDPVEVHLSTIVPPQPIPVPVADFHDTTPMGVEEVHGMLSALARRIREPAVCLAATKQLLELWKQFPDRANPNKEASREVLYATKEDIVNELRSRYRSKQREMGINLSFKDPIVDPVVEEPKDPEKLN